MLTTTRLPGCFLIEPKRFEDERGFFVRAWSAATFNAHGLSIQFVETNISFSYKKNTLRGMHYQAPPYEQAKLVRCTRGAIFDVGLDLRADSPTFKQWVGVELSAENRLMLFIPAGFAHGFQTLMDNSEVLYQVSNIYAPDHSHGVRWNDPAFKIVWPDAEKLIMIARDRDYPDFEQ